ncbi:MAG: glycosyltransferase family 39 protein [Planctomycetaceae bacterium]|nr:glycosyltransferase family 39 protein [Planctomycetaceae bacterium]
MTDTIETNYFSSRIFRFVLFVILVVLAAMLRFYHLETWSHGFDENYTTMETRYFFEGQPIPSYMFKNSQFDLKNSQFSRLPPMIIAAYYVHWLNYRLFGDDEFGSRILPAVMGSFCVGIVFLLAYPLFGGSASLILAVLILLFPDHILQSQNNRFYSQTFLCLSVVLLLGGYVAAKRSVIVAILLGPVSILMVLSHSLTGLIWGFLLIALLAVFVVKKQAERKNISLKNILSCKIVWILGFWSVVLLAIAVVHILPLAQSWNNFPTTNVSSIHAVFGLAFGFGWSLFMLCVPAWLFVLFHFKKSSYGYWCVLTILCGAAVFLLPLKIAYLVHYRFLFSFPFLVILALFIDWIGRLIIQSEIPYRRTLCYVWIIFVMFSNIPVLAGYYQDGGRYDWRAAYQYIREQWQPNDQIVCFPLAANRYIPELEPKIFLREINETALQELLNRNQNLTGRIWIPVVFNRYEPDENTRRWLYNRTEYQTRFGKKRYDFESNFIELFLYFPDL